MNKKGNDDDELMSSSYLEIEGAIETNTRPNLPLFVTIIRWLRGSIVIVVVVEIFEVILIIIKLNAAEAGRRGREVGFVFGFGFRFGFGSVLGSGGRAFCIVVVVVVDFVFGERPKRRRRRYWERTEGSLSSHSETIFHDPS